VVSYQMARNRALQVTAANDTSILLLNPDGTVRASVREGGEAFGPEDGEFSQFQLWLRKGVTALEGGLTARRILKFWPVADDRLIAQVQLGGGGVTGRNNSALVNPTQSKPLQDLTAP
jgi:hypothetical protein